MIQIHATKKLSALLPLDTAGLLPQKNIIPFLEGKAEILNNPLNFWHVNVVLIQRRHNILFVHDRTRFPVFIPGMKKSDLGNLNLFFQDCFMNTLMKSGANEQQMDRATQLQEQLCFDNICNRSVQGSMNQMMKLAEHNLWYNQININEITGYRLGAWLADTPCSVKGQKETIWPKTAMLELLDSE